MRTKSENQNIEESENQTENQKREPKARTKIENQKREPKARTKARTNSENQKRTKSENQNTIEQNMYRLYHFTQN